MSFTLVVKTTEVDTKLLLLKDVINKCGSDNEMIPVSFITYDGKSSF